MKNRNLFTLLLLFMLVTLIMCIDPYERYEKEHMPIITSNNWESTDGRGFRMIFDEDHLIVYEKWNKILYEGSYSVNRNVLYLGKQEKLYITGGLIEGEYYVDTEDKDNIINWKIHKMK